MAIVSTGLGGMLLNCTKNPVAASTPHIITQAILIMMARLNNFFCFAAGRRRNEERNPFSATARQKKASNAINTVAGVSFISQVLIRLKKSWLYFLLGWIFHHYVFNGLQGTQISVDGFDIVIIHLRKQGPGHQRITLSRVVIDSGRVTLAGETGEEHGF